LFEPFHLFFQAILNIGAWLGLTYVVTEPSFGSHELYIKFIGLSEMFFRYSYFLFMLVSILRLRVSSRFFSTHFYDLVFFAPLFLINFEGVHAVHILLIRQGTAVFAEYLNQYTFGHLADSIARRPARLVLTSFFGVIALGAFILVMPVSVAANHSPSLLTALFTSTSAVCVTGLIVEDTGTYFSTFGQIIIIALIQIGGLGLMTLSAGISLIAGKRMGMTHSSLMQEVLDLSDLVSLKSTLHDIFLWAFLIEFCGAIIISLRLYILKSCCISEAVFSGIFHSISAFCNAGFSIYPDNLMGFQSDPVINFTVMGLIVTGGLGFTVLGSINSFLRGAKNQRLNTHTWLVVVVSFILIIVGAIFILALENDTMPMHNLSTFDKIMAALFQSVSTRTAGFNTIDLTCLKTSTLFFMCILMFIGASPGSTGGGIKTTTFATLFLFVKAKLKGQSQVNVRGRRIPDETILKSFLIVALSASLVALFTFLMILTEEHQLIQIIFEVISAFATVGLSTGITPQLTAIGKLLIIVLMFIGRTGPVTMALSITSQSSRVSIQYPETRVLVG